MSDATNATRQVKRILEAAAALLDGVPERAEVEALARALTSAETEAAVELRGLCAEMDDEELHDLRVEATGLFWSYRLDAPHPYASVHASGKRLLMGDEAVEVAHEYARFGFEPQVGGDGEEPPDYLPHELGFAAFLAGAAADGDDEAAHDLRDFSARHLLTWLPALLADVEGAAESAFYPALIRTVIEVLPGS